MSMFLVSSVCVKMLFRMFCCSYISWGWGFMVRIFFRWFIMVLLWRNIFTMLIGLFSLVSEVWTGLFYNFSFICVGLIGRMW